MQAQYERNPGSVDPRIDLADMLFTYDRAKDAVAVCEEILQINPKIAAGHAIMGASLGTLARNAGFELEFGYANDFYGRSRAYSSSVLTLTGNFLLDPEFLALPDESASPPLVLLD